jgi:hypothetical protein
MAWPIRGATVCRLHGGAAPAVRAAAERRRAEDGARALVAGYLHDPDAEPVTSYSTEVARLAGAVRAAIGVSGQAVNDLEGRWSNVDKKGTAALRPEVQLWQHLTTRYGDLLLGAARLGLDERRVRVEEQVTALLIEGLRWLASATAEEFGWQDLERQAYDGLTTEMLQRLARSEAELT